MAVRGYAEWKPKGEAIHWVRATNQVLEEYKDYWPLSVRQIFYRLVAAHSYPKSEAAYNKLTGILSRGRRAGYVEWEAIRDGGQGSMARTQFFMDEAAFERTIQSAAKNLKLDRQEGQPREIELWCEAGGMVPILSDIAEPYTVRVNTGGGYDSVTAKHKLAKRVRMNAELGMGTTILHVGDFDGSGEDMCNVLREDTLFMVITQLGRAVREEEIDEVPEAVRMFVDGHGDPAARQEATDWLTGYFEVKRVALTGEQVVERGVETAPPKPSDSRSAEFKRRNAWVAEELGTSDITAQLEALTPPELNALLSSAIEAELDMDVYRDVLVEEQKVRADLLTRLAR